MELLVICSVYVCMNVCISIDTVNTSIVYMYSICYHGNGNGCYTYIWILYIYTIQRFYV